MPIIGPGDVIPPDPGTQRGIRRGLSIEQGRGIAQQYGGAGRARGIIRAAADPVHQAMAQARAAGFGPIKIADTKRIKAMAKWGQSYSDMVTSGLLEIPAPPVPPQQSAMMRKAAPVRVAEVSDISRLRRQKTQPLQAHATPGLTQQQALEIAQQRGSRAGTSTVRRITPPRVQRMLEHATGPLTPPPAVEGIFPAQSTAARGSGASIQVGTGAGTSATRLATQPAPGMPARPILRGTLRQDPSPIIDAQGRLRNPATGQYASGPPKTSPITSPASSHAVQTPSGWRFQDPTSKKFITKPSDVDIPIGAGPRSGILGDIDVPERMQPSIEEPVRRLPTEQEWRAGERSKQVEQQAIDQGPARRGRATASRSKAREDFWNRGRSRVSAATAKGKNLQGAANPVLAARTDIEAQQLRNAAQQKAHVDVLEQFGGRKPRITGNPSEAVADAFAKRGVVPSSAMEREALKAARRAGRTTEITARAQNIARARKLRKNPLQPWLVPPKWGRAGSVLGAIPGGVMGAAMGGAIGGPLGAVAGAALGAVGPRRILRAVNFGAARRGATHAAGGIFEGAAGLIGFGGRAALSTSMAGGAIAGRMGLGAAVGGAIGGLPGVGVGAALGAMPGMGLGGGRIAKGAMNLAARSPGMAGIALGALAAIPKLFSGIKRAISADDQTLMDMNAAPHDVAMGMDPANLNTMGLTLALHYRK